MQLDEAIKNKLINAITVDEIPEVTHMHYIDWN